MIKFMIGICMINFMLICILVPIKLVERQKEKKSEKEQLEKYNKY